MQAHAIADPRALNGPCATLTLVFADPNLAARLERWQDRAHELTAALRGADPVPAEVEVENLVRGIASTRAAIREAEAALLSVEADVTSAVAAGKDPAPVEARAEAASARLKTLRARLGPLEARHAGASTERNRQAAALARGLRASLQTSLRRLRAEVVARLDEDALREALDEVAAIGVAIGIADGHQ